MLRNFPFLRRALGVPSEMAWRILVASFLLFPLRPQAETFDKVAFIESVYPAGNELARVVRIRRGDADVTIANNPVDLLPGDSIFLRQARVVVRVRMLGDGTVIPVFRSSAPTASAQPDYVVPRPAIPGVGDNLFAFFAAFWKGNGETVAGPVLPGSRGVGTQSTCFNAAGQSNQPLAFEIPALSGQAPGLEAGRRGLFVSWRGGVPPFAVELASATGQVIAARTGIADACATRLPPADLPLGRYQLTLSDGNGYRVVDDSIQTYTSVPAMPQPLASSKLANNVKDLYFATWLAAIDGGRWAFEAQQRVSSMDCRSPAVREWLARWGGVLPLCQEGAS